MLGDARCSLEGECAFNREVDLSIAGRSPTPKFVLTFRESQGLENDADVYLAELARRGLEARKLPIPRCGSCQGGVQHKCSPKLTTAMLEDIAEHLSWCDVLVGFESIGNEDDRVWQCVKQERARRPALLVALVPNLEWCKLSTGWTKHTVQELLKPQAQPCGIDVIIAKTECTFERLQQLWLGTRFAREHGNLLLIPHTSCVVEDAAAPPPQQPPPRRDVIVFAGYSEAKNTTECVKAAVALVKEAENNLGRVIIKCSHKCGPPSAAAAVDAAAACAESAAKKQRVDEESKQCKCEKARDQHNRQGGVALIELVENRITEAEKAGLYRRCRLAICASKREGFGHTILEAAAYGCQVVTTDGMPMKSILRQQVGLVKPSKESSWNLGINYEVKAADIVAAARALLREDHDMAACQRQQMQRVADFRRHFDHFIGSILPPGGLPRQPPRCSNASHRCAFRQESQAPCVECRSGRLHADLKTVNWNLADRLVWRCSNPECRREMAI